MIKKLTRDIVSEHNNEKSCWVIYNSCVYDVTGYLKIHPGGSKILLRYGGKDITEIFDVVHGYVNIHKMLEGCLIGYID
ncbi:Flavohemoprotein b5+b5R [Trachipleistophora hominis]|uniref:Flavohemoprotein b5+b5R n=1 Tax=Trachipleistophora hominis TaxID=72359 RepID=L7JY59_TRAHO|nr:Flavohemoprotein b5+b5R [Trachipleistophora hominis]